jgi:hypothetical protein
MLLRADSPQIKIKACDNGTDLYNTCYLMVKMAAISPDHML